MTIDFYTNHMKTLADLQALAEKHNCQISMGFYSNSDNDLNEDLLEKHGFAPPLIEELRENFNIKYCQSRFDQAWFELYDKRTGEHNGMSYNEDSIYFEVEHPTQFLDDPSDELIAKLEECDEYRSYDEYIISLYDNPTIIRGFNNLKPIEDYRVYRSGMALHFFAELVCDYLGEPRIERVY